MVVARQPKGTLKTKSTQPRSETCMVTLYCFTYSLPNGASILYRTVWKIHLLFIHSVTPNIMKRCQY